MANYLSFEVGMKIECGTAIAPLRALPSETAELESQILYGEMVEILETGQKDWIRIRNFADQYEGWSDRKHFISSDTENIYFVMDLLAPVKNERGHFQLPFGSKLDLKTAVTNEVNYMEPISFDADKAIHYAIMFENAPYLWGGKTLLGIDCSGLMQLIHQPLSISLPRNASQQEKHGTLIKFGDHKAGDLAFFANENGKVVHVGIVSGIDNIWHASGCVRKDLFTSEGILNTNTYLISHRLHSIKRYY